MAKIVVGMSGGVDSSVVALLLKQQGHEVIGCFMQNWDPAVNNDIADPFMESDICQAEIDFQDAKNVADKIGVEIHRVNFVKEYWDNVFSYFIDEYKKGRTPNPDVFCNKYIKFRAFLDYANENFDCDYIAMGHYAKVTHDPVRLLKAKDQNKDQTYFLEQLNKEQLSKSLFPLGDMTKEEVRKIAEDNDLITANKKDSTGICFIGERNFALFLSGYITKQPGDIVDIDSGVILNQHNGMMNYTIGQRKGLDIGGRDGYNNEPWYVVKKDVANNIVYVAQGDSNKHLLSDKATVINVNYTTDLDILTAKFRYRSKEVEITSYTWIDDTTVEINYVAESAVTPGQACVFYNGDVCLGGGEIDEVTYMGELRAYENSTNN